MKTSPQNRHPAYVISTCKQVVAEEISRCDISDTNFQKHGIIDVLFESARNERDLAAVETIGLQ